VPLPAPRAERASQIVFQEGELPPAARTWAPATSPGAPIPPEPTAPLAQSP
jgi:hypothetical protein